MAIELHSNFCLPLRGNFSWKSFWKNGSEIISTQSSNFNPLLTLVDKLNNMIALVNEFQTSQSNQLDEKKHLLREVVEAIMWELDSMRQGRWENIHTLTKKKQTLIERIETFDWNPRLPENQDTELHMLQAHIMDLEYQLKKTIDSHLAVIKAQLDDISLRTHRIRNSLRIYRAGASY